MLAEVIKVFLKIVVNTTHHFWNSRYPYLKSVYSCWTRKKKQLPKEHYLELKLEDIVSNFSETYKRLCQYLNVDPKDDILLNTNYNPEKAHIGRWRKELSNKEQEELNNYFSKLITQLNYTWLMRLIHKSTYLVKTPAATKIGYQN